ncbi:translation initiation factor IF-2 [Candidatus Formimonas warabiya]|uniref:Translation initiation factor IF-2 n=1 Tax=Formimonas warabiya TaxID=1761012 RepID=A0A3G1KPY4_FORW1|nr:translation initiation factor IF-2 [Candidatus Formimonas warabiya]ATW24205.1 translation initiation factor IF-2 [Candidatus Formimonas warabiya]
MGKLRVYELAKELSMESREVIRRLGKMGLELKNHMSTVDDKYADSLREMVKPNPPKTDHHVQNFEVGAKKPEQRQENKSFHKTEYSQERNKPGQSAVEHKNPQRFDNTRVNNQNKPDYSRGNNQNRADNFRGNNQNRPDQPRVNYQNRPDQGRPNNQNRPDQPRVNYQNRPDQGRPNNQNRPDQERANHQNRPDNSRVNHQNRPDYSRNRNNENTGGPGSKPFPPKQEKKPDRGPIPPNLTKPGAPKNVPKPKEPFKFGEKDFDEDHEAKAKNPRFTSYQHGDKDGFRPGGKRKNQNRKKGSFAQKMEQQPVTPKKVVIGETVTVQELAKSMGKTGAEVIRRLMELGVLATINQEIDAETAVVIGQEFGIPVEIRLDKTMEMMEDQEDEDEELLVERPPVVTVMGHVDHGKTSLLDAIRKANVTATEAGGITQHIGAYQVEVNNKRITFLDTPGHEAFTAMRARGAQVTDIAIIVVAADDGVMPQTVEAINHSKAAKVPIIVAINKMDKPNANPDRVKQELTEHQLVAEEWGGETIMVPVSAKTHEGISHLLEMILLVAEVGELKVNPERIVRGTVIESELDKGRGPVATVLVQKGTLKIGDNIVAGTAFGKVRAMIDDKGRRVKNAGPSTPVEVLGFSDVPPVGEPFVGVQDEKDARYIAGKYQIKKREEDLNKTARVSLDDLFKQISEGNVKDLNIIIKADVQGSIEALSQSLTNLSTSEVRVNTIHSGVGTISESDVMLAAASNAIIIGFNVRPDANTRKAAENEKVDIKLYRVIYDAIDDIKAAMAGLLEPSYKEVVIGHAEVRATFKVPKVGVIAGSYVSEGKITRQAGVRVIRDGIVIHEGHIDSLKRFKDDAKEVLTGYECGIGVENFNDLKIGDVIEAYIMEEAKREL